MKIPTKKADTALASAASSSQLTYQPKTINVRKPKIGKHNIHNTMKPSMFSSIISSYYFSNVLEGERRARTSLRALLYSVFSKIPLTFPI